jgi:hypothetical protein
VGRGGGAHGLRAKGWVASAAACMCARRWDRMEGAWQRGRGIARVATFAAGGGVVGGRWRRMGLCGVGQAVSWAGCEREGAARPTPLRRCACAPGTAEKRPPTPSVVGAEPACVHANPHARGCCAFLTAHVVADSVSQRHAAVVIAVAQRELLDGLLRGRSARALGGRRAADTSAASMQHARSPDTRGFSLLQTLQQLQQCRGRRLQAAHRGCSTRGKAPWRLAFRNQRPSRESKRMCV